MDSTPAHGRGHLPNQRVAFCFTTGDDRCVHIADQGKSSFAKADGLEDGSQTVLRGLHECAMEGRRDV